MRVASNPSLSVLRDAPFRCLIFSFFLVSNHWIITAADLIFIRVGSIRPDGKKRCIILSWYLPPNVPWGTARRRAKHPAFPYSFSDKRPCYFSPSQKNPIGMFFWLLSFYLFLPRADDLSLLFQRSSFFLFIIQQTRVNQNQKLVGFLLRKKDFKSTRNGRNNRKKRTKWPLLIFQRRSNIRRRIESCRYTSIECVALIAGSCSPDQPASAVVRELTRRDRGKNRHVGMYSQQGAIQRL